MDGGGRHEGVDAGFRVQGSGCRVQGAGLRLQGSGCRVQGSGFRFQGSGYEIQGSGIKNQGPCTRNPHIHLAGYELSGLVTCWRQVGGGALRQLTFGDKEEVSCRTSQCVFANMAHVRQSLPDSGLGFQVEVLQIHQVLPFSLENLEVGGGYGGAVPLLRPERYRARPPPDIRSNVTIFRQNPMKKIQFRFHFFS